MDIDSEMLTEKRMSIRCHVSDAGCESEMMTRRREIAARRRERAEVADDECRDTADGPRKEPELFSRGDIERCQCSFT